MRRRDEYDIRFREDLVKPVRLDDLRDDWHIGLPPRADANHPHAGSPGPESDLRPDPADTDDDCRPAVELYTRVGMRRLPQFLLLVIVKRVEMPGEHKQHSHGM